MCVWWLFGERNLGPSLQRRSQGSRTPTSRSWQVGERGCRREGSQACWGWEVTACPPQCDPHGHVPHSVSPASVTPQCVPHCESPQHAPQRASPCVPPTVHLRPLAAGAGRHALPGSPVALPQEMQEPSPTAASPPSSPLLHLHFWGALCKPLLPGLLWGSPA